MSFAPITINTAATDSGIGTMTFEADGRLWGRFRDGLGGFVRLVGAWTSAGDVAAEAVDGSRVMRLKPSTVAKAALEGEVIMRDGEVIPVLVYPPGRDGVTSYGISRRVESRPVVPFAAAK